MSGNDVERLLREEHIRPEDLLTDGPNNRLNLTIDTEETTIGKTKGEKKAEAKISNIVHIQRTMVITNHEEVIKVFLPIIAFSASLLLLCQSLIVIGIFLSPLPSNTKK
ncbi:hypothetical protein GCK72_018398 [Caenorhabditis remanei]|uniref:Uncharacterized protein n=1 Tax=Caenorhabditis remanei TaxID=31234 RepID=A0A6A5GAZ3_CAERE|nr:hypothetical protein GCK72_018398 [Caenorhabditis remanei]KAF1751844.1 hypothetical protein GCK72_018398 [Caenorhabditis remanei]